MNNSLFQGNALTTGSKNDPLLPKLIMAINNATEIEISVSFVQPSGLNLLLPALYDALQAGASIKILTSDYLQITSPEALRQLIILGSHGAETKLFCCGANSAFHMKAYLFIKEKNGVISEGCAYVGSNNISLTALTQSHEWTLRHDYLSHNNDVTEFTNIRQQFNAIFCHPQSRSLTDELWSDYLKRYQKNKQQRLHLVTDATEDEQPVVPNEAQIHALAALNDSRQQGYRRGLVVLATGMGKTWLAAFDANQCKARRILFVAHREEILLQAQQSFSQINPTKTSGLYLGSEKNAEAEMLFASIQTLSKPEHLQRFAAEHFDYIVVDEFHHAGSPSYHSLLNHFNPGFLLGLTATPERSDQADILALCDNNLVFERNVVHGIEARILVPFHYYGINDEFVDYQEIPWRSGKFDAKALDSAFATHQRAKHILTHWQKHTQQRTLAFCVSKQHAEYMANYFNDHGVRAAAVYHGSKLRRNDALAQLNQSQIQVLFSVDLFNEGTDLPAIDTVLMLRPTESKILFLQQLGRGLRRADELGKTHLVVIDFIGNHQSFLNKPAAIYGVTGVKSISNIIRTAPTIAPGCFINFDPAIIDFWQRLSKQIKNSSAEDYQQLSIELGHPPTAAEFFLAGYNLKKVQQEHGSWFALVAKQSQDERIGQLVEKYSDWLFSGIETTAMSKSFKMILLHAFLELDGLKHPVSTENLAQKSREILWRKPNLVEKDVPSNLVSANNSKAWHQYWLKNPITFYCTPSARSEKSWFSLNDGKMQANFTVNGEDIAPLTELMIELIDLRLAQYSLRNTPKAPVKTGSKLVSIAKEEAPSANVVPFYPNLKIACGHFGKGSSDDAQLAELSASYGQLDAERFFIAPAKGNSMNGGKQPIVDGDLLLFEWVSPVKAGSISNNIMAIEQLDESGDATYLLRVVKKQADGSYLLKANNSDYEDLLANDTMRTFARLKAIIDKSDLENN